MTKMEYYIMKYHRAKERGYWAMRHSALVQMYEEWGTPFRNYRFQLDRWINLI